ncbi:MAG: DUF4160 domain-containing protein [Chitinophagales bacterium]|jgi:hypothetical protein|nr:DUF4160 domain-containing protein [Sphingobacteriales bacterium]
MPEIFRFFGIRFFFFSNEHSPIHVHLKNADGTAKIAIEPNIELIENKGMKSKDIHLALSIIEENKDVIISRWNEFFS